MGQHPNFENQENAVGKFSSSRRDILRLGAAGLPMLVTLRASANEALVSQLRCQITIPSRTAILVHTDGRVWISQTNVGNPDNLNESRIANLVANAEFTFPEGTAPQRFRPEGCGDDDNNSCNNGTGSGNGNGNNDQGDYNNGCGNGDNSDNDNFNPKSGGSGGGGSSDDDDDDNEFRTCDYNLIYFDGQESFPVSEVISESGSTDTSDPYGLYTLLAIQYAQSNAGSDDFPGVSCVVSVLNYINS